jgi:hypothetical protein
VALYCVLKHRITSFNTVANSSTSVKSNNKNIDVSEVQILTLAVYNDKKHTINLFYSCPFHAFWVGVFVYYTNQLHNIKYI